MIRPQYHFRQSERGLLAWNVHRLITLSESFPIFDKPLSDIAELSENHWYGHGNDAPTCLSIIEHCQLIEACNFNHPIILGASGRVMDGMHRVCKAYMKGMMSVLAVQFVQDPEPDYIDCDPQKLPYDSNYYTSP